MMSNSVQEQLNRAAMPQHEDCDRCNYDTHYCHGCGTDVAHGRSVCDDCAERD